MLGLIWLSFFLILYLSCYQTFSYMRGGGVRDSGAVHGIIPSNYHYNPVFPFSLFILLLFWFHSLNLYHYYFIYIFIQPIFFLTALLLFRLWQKKAPAPDPYKDISGSKSMYGSSALNPVAVFLRFFTVSFLLFLTPAGGSNPTGPTF